MTDPEPHTRHADDASADDGPPTDAFTDDVRADAATAEDANDAASAPPGADSPSSEDEPPR